MPRPDETWMWERARSLIDQADRLQRQFFQPGGTDSDGSSVWEPPVDIFETETDVWILVALPGVGANDVHVRLQGIQLVISARRALPPALRAAELKRLEIPRGRFERRLELAPGTYKVDSNEMVNGCLALRLAKHN